MNKYILIGIVIALAIGGLFFVTRKNKGTTTNTTTGNESQKSKDIFKDISDMCATLSKDQVSTLLGKPIIKTTPVTTNTIHSCQYYLTDTQAVTVNLDTYNVEDQKKGHVYMGRKIITNPQIPMEHFVVIQEDGLINEIYLVLGPSKFVSINRTSAKTLTEDETIAFAAKLAGVITGKTPMTQSTKSSPTPTKTTVPLPQETDIVRTFFNLIEEKKPADAASMMNVSNDSQKQAWAVQFNAITSMKVLKIEPSMTESWTDTKHSYRVTMDVTMSPNSANAPIPYYGWENGQNIRWINLEKVGNLWKISGIATGP